jgi:hypothetical protein
MTARRRAAAAEDGNIVMVLLGIMVLLMVCVAAMAQFLMVERVSRHDRDFDHALAAAETGLDQMVTAIKAAPFAATVTPVSGTDATTHMTYSASAVGSNGHWLITANGHPTAGGTVSRTITQQVDVTGLLNQPLFGTSFVTVGGGSASAVDTYDSAVSSAVCTTTGAAASMTAADTRMCTHASPALGSVGTNGPLTFPGAALPNVAGVEVYDAGIAGAPNPLNAGRCVGEPATCAVAHSHPGALSFPLSSLCAHGIGAGATSYTGSVALAANAVYSFRDITLNATAVANLANLSGSTLVLCFSGRLDVVPDLPLNAVLSQALPPRYAPRAPSTLLLIGVGSGTPTVRLNAGRSQPSMLSAVVYAPTATCTATDHVDLYGVMVCGAVTAPSGIDVHYDTQIAGLAFDQPVTVQNWREN